MKILAATFVNGGLDKVAKIGAPQRITLAKYWCVERTTECASRPVPSPSTNRNRSPIPLVAIEDLTSLNDRQ